MKGKEINAVSIDHCKGEQKNGTVEGGRKEGKKKGRKERKKGERKTVQ